MARKTMTGFPEWLPDRYRYVRYVPNIATWDKYCPYPRGLCGWCGGPVRRKNGRWCSKACSNEFNIRRGAAWHIIPLIAARDKKICALCGERACPPEYDHIIPVAEGGGCCGLENLRTLCRACHLSETAALAARRAEARKPTKQLKLEGL